MSHRIFVVVVIVILAVALALFSDFNTGRPLWRQQQQQQQDDLSTPLAAANLLSRQGVLPLSPTLVASLELPPKSRTVALESGASRADSTRFTSTVASQIMQVEPTLSAIEKHMETVLACARNASLGRRSMWHLEERRCSVFADFEPPLEKFEFSSGELSCEYDDVREEEQQHQQHQPDMWQRRGFLKRFATQWNTNSSSSGGDDKKTNNVSAFESFQYHTSWLFENHLPYSAMPKPVPATLLELAAAVNDSSATEQEQKLLEPLRLRGFHDDEAEGLYRLEKTCLSPFGGLSGWRPDAAPFAGRDETRDKIFKLYAARELYFSIRSLPQPPSAFDQRPFVLFDTGVKGSGNNLAHQLLRLLSLIGTLTHNEGSLFSDGKKTQAGNRRNPLGFDVKPLLVFVWVPHRPPKGPPTPLTSAFSFYLRLLDLPWAAIATPRENEGNTFRMIKHIWHRKGRTGYSFDSNATRSSVCFERGLMWFNCKSCPSEIVPYEREPFSFGMFVDGTTPERVAVLQQYRRMTAMCLGRFYSSGSSSISRVSAAAAAAGGGGGHQGQLALPQVFFDVRETDRFFRESGLYLDLVRLRTVGTFVSGVVFAEPGQGSRAAYINKLSRSDILIGSHGAAFTGAALLRPRSVVVELSFVNHHTFVCSFAKSCWFAPYSQALGHEHIVYPVAPSHALLPNRDRVFDWVACTAPAMLSDAIAEASCRWHAINSGYARKAVPIFSSSGEKESSSSSSSSSSSVFPSADPELIARCKERRLWRRRYPTEEPASKNYSRVGDDQHFVDLVLLLTGQAVPLPLPPPLAREVAKLREYFHPWSFSHWGPTQHAMEGHPAALWMPLLQHFVHVSKWAPGIRVSASPAGGAAPSKGFAKLACLHGIGGALGKLAAASETRQQHPWCLYVRASSLLDGKPKFVNMSSAATLAAAGETTKNKSSSSSSASAATTISVP